MKRAAIYIRVSSDEQAEDTHGLYNQINTCYDYAISKGYTLVGDRFGDLSSGQEVIKDGERWKFAYPKKAEEARAKVEAINPIPCYVEDYTGKRTNRPAMDALRDFVERVGLDVLIPRDTQRFARKRHVAGYLKDWFRRFGVGIDYATQDFQDNAAGHAQEGMHEVFDQWEADQLREKAIRGRRDSARKGNIVLSQPPYGLEKVGERKDAELVINEELAQVVKNIYTWYVFGDESGEPLTLLKLALKLTGLKIPTAWDLAGRKKKSGYGVWNPPSIRNILTNPVYIGKWTYGKTRRVLERIRETPDGRREIVEVNSSEAVPREQWIEVDVPAILEGEEGRALWEAAQERLKENKRLAERNGGKYQYLLRGMLRCRCGRTMVGAPAPGGEYCYYRCNRKLWEKSARRYAHCDAPMLRADKADAAMWEEIKGKLLDSDNLTRGLRNQKEEMEKALAPLKDELQWTEGELSQVETRLSRALDLYMDGKYPKEWLDKQIAGEQKRKEDLERNRRNLLGRIEAGRVSDEDIQTVEAFAEEIAGGLNNATFEERRRILEIVQVQGVVTPIEGGHRIDGSWLIPKQDLTLTVTSATRWPFPIDRRS